MRTPSEALAWEFWRRHRTRLIVMLALLLGFAVIYPQLCALAGFDSQGPDALDSVVKIIPQGGQLSAWRIFHVLYAFALGCGPTLAMVLSLLCVTWMGTFTGMDAKSNDPLTFQERLFALPVSTSFLFWRLFLGGQLVIMVFCTAWIHLVRLPHLGLFDAYQNCFVWMTLLALAQGIVWALSAAWPIARALLMAALLFGFCFCPAYPEIAESPFLLVPAFILGMVSARRGMEKMRHGEWQGWNWERLVSRFIGVGEMRGPKRFASPTQAQLWFEWRRFGRGICLTVAALVVTPLVIHLMFRFGVFFNAFPDFTFYGFVAYVISVPWLIHLGFALSPSRNDLDFMLVRPMNNGQAVMAIVKAAGISAVLSWLIVFLTLGVMALLGDFHAVMKLGNVSDRGRLFIAFGLMLVTWRMIPANLCFVLSGNRRLAVVPVLAMIVVFFSFPLFSIVSKNEEYWNIFRQLLPLLMTGLLAGKILLAYGAFRRSLTRRLLTASSMLAYVGMWALLTVSMLVPLILLFHDKEWIIPASLGVLLVVPLARVGLAPIALAHNRHA